MVTPVFCEPVSSATRLYGEKNPDDGGGEDCAVVSIASLDKEGIEKALKPAHHT